MLNIPVIPVESVFQTPKIWIERALAADRAETDAAIFRASQMGGVFN